MITLRQAERARVWIGSVCQTHDAFCEECNAEDDDYMCDEMKRLILLKWKWTKRVAIIAKEAMEAPK